MTDIPADVDGIRPAENTRPAQEISSVNAPQVRKWKRLFLFVGGTAYVAYILWAFVLLLLLPSTSEALSMLVPLGVLSAAVAGVALLSVMVVVLMHVSQTKVSSNARMLAMLKVLGVTLPGILLSAGLPFAILREPALIIDIVDPAGTEPIVAPTFITFDASRAAAVMSRTVGTPIQYKWDLNGDQKADRETLEPRLTVMFEQQGVYGVSVSMIAPGSGIRTATRRLLIANSVFAVEPADPVREVPAVFSVANLVSAPEDILSVDWDFDGDGTVDESTPSEEISYTYYQTGSYLVTATITLQSQTQTQYRRTVTVVNPDPLPFPVRIETEPDNLIGTPPFSALFSIETDEDLLAVQWTFGDGERAEGTRVTHTFERKGTYAVQAKVRSASGSVADIATVVKVVDKLNISDLSFEGSHKVSGANVRGQVPLTLSLRPVTTLPFIQFVWEAPGATEVGSTQTELQAIYRREGTYTTTLIGRDSDDRVLRYPITITVEPPSSELSIAMSPTSGVAPLEVTFDASESSIPGEEITGFVWSFGDGSQRVYGAARAEHTFEKAGSYVIEATIRTTSGKEYRATKTLVVREPLLQACILPTRTQGAAPLGVEFRSDCSAGKFASSLWDFGDGSQSDVANPIHVFDRPGSYLVTLRITDQSGAVSTASVTITVL